MYLIKTKRIEDEDKYSGQSILNTFVLPASLRISVEMITLSVCQ